MADPDGNPADTVLAFLGAAALTLAVFLLLPLSRMLSPDPAEERWSIRQVERVEIPPPPPPPEPEPEEESAAPSEASPDLRPPPPDPPLRSLPVALDVRPDPDLFATPAIHSLAGELDVGEEIRRFTFDDLEGGPRALSVPPVSIPVALARRGFGRGEVVFSIRILPDGSVEVLDVVSSTHPELVEAARRSAARARFEPPEINGQRVSVEGNWPLIIESTRR
ncbi:MAG: TonB family protein [Puniceicoccaceae bacterium]